MSAGAATVRGVPAGTLLQARAIEVEAADTGKYEAGPVQDFVSAGDTTYVFYGTAADVVGTGHRVRVQIVQHGTAPATLQSGTAKALFWR